MLGTGGMGSVIVATSGMPMFSIDFIGTGGAGNNKSGGLNGGGSTNNASGGFPGGGGGGGGIYLAGSGMVIVEW